MGRGFPAYYREIVDFKSTLVSLIQIDYFFIINVVLTKLSFGIWDLDLEKQKEVTSVLSPEIVRSCFHNINFDILVRLLKQPVAVTRKTMKKALEMQPDRLKSIYVSYSPIDRHQDLKQSIEKKQQVFMLKNTKIELRGDSHHGKSAM